MYIYSFRYTYINTCIPTHISVPFFVIYQQVSRPRDMEYISLPLLIIKYCKHITHPRSASTHNAWHSPLNPNRTRLNQHPFQLQI